MATGDWILGLHRKCRCKDPAHRQLTKRWVSNTGRLRCAGLTKRLTASAAYPPMLARALISSWSKAQRLCAVSCSPVSSSSWLCPEACDNICNVLPRAKPRAKSAPVKSRSKSHTSASWMQPSVGEAKEASMETPSSTDWQQPSASELPTLSQKLDDFASWLTPGHD